MNLNENLTKCKPFLATEYRDTSDRLFFWNTIQKGSDFENVPLYTVDELKGLPDPGGLNNNQKRTGASIR
ncbi:hypothetical protein DSCOOX_64850 [Desulfosarcina ovata subsp. ovata]|uniref:Uncharacterized protein n=1 Tax=Desulfosarcina ovata subsp. ovata TaxID=2752305 RepID=A0A5K8AKP8_9BACT|nr:hypothetical protein DSCOOX_64850 [Desulfosarcina ovata subsp. ovata]